MAFYEGLRHALHRYAEGVHQPGPPLSRAAAEAAARRLQRPIAASYLDLLRSFNGMQLFHEQVHFYAADDPALRYVRWQDQDELRIGEGEEGAYALCAGGEVRVLDEDLPDPIIAGTTLERLLEGIVAREGIVLQRDGEYRDVFDEEGDLLPEARRRRVRAGRAKDPGAALYLLEETELLLEEEDNEGAMALLQQAVARDPQAGPAWELMGALHRAAGRQAEASAALLRAAEVTRAGRLRAWRLLDVAELTPGEALTHARAAWEADPRHGELLLQEVRDRLDQGQRDEAQRISQRLELLLQVAPSAALQAEAALLARDLRVREALKVL